MTILASIWAQDARRIIGTGSAMPWRVPADFAHFKRSTMGCPIIMGRRSWQALGAPLPGRTNIVLTRTKGFEAPGAVVVASIDEAIELGIREAQRSGAPYVWITGGGALYEQTMGLVDELVVTDLDLDIVPGGDSDLVCAPVIDESVWRVDEERSDADWQPVSGDAAWRVTTYVRR